MHSQITESAAKELGRSLRFIRHARSLHLRDAAKMAELSPQYLAEIETARKLGVTEDALLRLAKPLGVPESMLLDLLLRARVHSALETRGLQPDQVAFVWRGIEQRLSEVGIEMKTDLGKIVADILA